MTAQDEANEEERRARWQALGIRTDVAHPARVYDYLLGGKDNISQVVPAIPHSGRTLTTQALQTDYSKTAAFADRDLSGTYIGAIVRFTGRVVLTPA
jgi:hypothetical protein